MKLSTPDDGLQIQTQKKNGSSLRQLGSELINALNPSHHRPSSPHPLSTFRKPSPRLLLLLAALGTAGQPTLQGCSGDNDDDDASIELPSTTPPTDADGDGHSPNLDGDCDDENPNVYPGATEVCNGVDDDCDGTIDDGVLTKYYQDKDGDTYGNDNVVTTACTAPDGYVDRGDDCDDENPNTYPGAAEGADRTGDGIPDADEVDNDCDGIIDNGTSGYDDDGDGTSEAQGDCNDADASVHQGAAESFMPDETDNDCDGCDLGTDEIAWTPRGCVTRYEGSVNSEGDAIFTIGQIPTAISTFEQAKSLCETRGLKVVSIEQLQMACKGPSNLPYPYGMSYIEGACNDYEAKYGAIAPTGFFAQCVSDYGVHDPVGNYWDVVSTDTGWALFGGSINSSRPSCNTIDYFDADSFTATFRCAEFGDVAVIASSVVTQ